MIGRDPQRRRPAITAIAAAAVLVGCLGLVAVGVRAGDGRAPAAIAVPGRPLAASPTVEEATTTTVAPTTTTAASATTVAPPRAPAASSRAAPPVPSGGGGPFVGVGTWVDVFDFDPAHTGGNPSVTPASVDRMAAAGIRTLYLQVARSEDPAAPGDLIAPDLLGAFLQRAHAHGIQVVGWFLPHLANLDDDMRHLQAALSFTSGGQALDAVGLDVEWRNSVPDHAERSARLVELSRRLRGAAGGRPVGAIVMPPVVTDVINPAFWPGYPWRSLAPLFDAWLPMSYWTNRAGDSPYRNAHRYTTDNIRLLRENLGNPGAPVHAIGGIGDKATTADYQGFRQACAEQATIGCSIYDWGTTSAGAWPILGG